MRKNSVGSFLAAAVAIIAVAGVSAAKVKIETQADKRFDFKTVRTYAWSPSGNGEVKVLQATGDDPAQLREQLEPMIKPAVDQSLAQSGLTSAPGDQADLHVYYYVLIGPNADAQHMGQFLPATPMWGVPPFNPGTSSLKIYEQGSLILDLTDPKQKSVIWRGTARAEIDRVMSETARRDRIQTAVREMLRKLPVPKSK